MSPARSLTAIVPCNDLDASEAFYGRLGLQRAGGDRSYRILSDRNGAQVHLTAAIAGWLVPGRNPFGLYLYTDEVEMLAGRFGLRAEDKPWGMYEFAVSDPDETLVRIGRPSVSGN
jgi:hypothetical protein